MIGRTLPVSKTVTIRLSDEAHLQLCELAQREGLSLPDFITAAALLYAEAERFCDEHEMDEIRSDVLLNRSLRRGMRDAEAGRGRFP